MIKCEVLGDAVLSIGKGSVVYVKEKQYQLARKVLKPIHEDEQKNVKPVEDGIEVVEVRTEEAKEKRTRKKK